MGDAMGMVEAANVTVAVHVIPRPHPSLEEISPIGKPENK